MAEETKREQDQTKINTEKQAKLRSKLSLILRMKKLSRKIQKLCVKN